jgi:hypothetical protein
MRRLLRFRVTENPNISRKASRERKSGEASGFYINLAARLSGRRPQPLQIDGTAHADTPVV